MYQRRVVKNILESKPEGRRKVGRPRLRWLDDAENDLRVMKVKRWRKKAQNREEWVSVIKEAKILKGP
jgi:plasmid maintenance system killer protein